MKNERNAIIFHSNINGRVWK